MINIGAYMQKKAENWVSTVVLGGCVTITLVLVYTAMQAEMLGLRLSDVSEVNASN